MPIRINRKLSKIKKKERRDGRDWRKKYSKSYYFDNNIKPYNTLVRDIQDAYLLLYQKINSVHGKVFYKPKKYSKKYDYNIIGILKVLHRFYDEANIRVTYKNLILSWGLAFDTKSKFYKKRIGELGFFGLINIPANLPAPYKTHFDNSSKNNRKEREDKITDYSFGKLENSIGEQDLKKILRDLALEIESCVKLKDNSVVSSVFSLPFPFIYVNAKEKHLFKLFDNYIKKILDNRKKKLTQKKYKYYMELLRGHNYLTILFGKK